MIKMRDKYLHTNCLAALANMSGQFRSLHPYVAQRLVSLFETLAKKHARLDQQLKHPNAIVAAGTTGTTTAPTTTAPTATKTAAAVVTTTPTTSSNMADEFLLDMSDPAVAEDMVQELFVFFFSCL